MRSYLIGAALPLLLCSQSSFGQTHTLNWNTSFTPAWADGATLGTANDVGGSTVDVTVNINKIGGVWCRSLITSGAMTPSKNGSYTTGTMAPPNNLMLALDFNNVNNYAEVNIEFSAAVFNVSFLIGDIDRHLRNRNDFMDEVVVEGNLGTVHPTFSAFTTDPAFPNQLTFSGDTVRVNPNGNLSGNAGPAGYPGTFDVMEQAGTARVSFGTAPITSIRIRYSSSPRAISNPTIQAIAISNLTFSRVFPLPVSFRSFKAYEKTGGTQLEWSTVNDADCSHYIVERADQSNQFLALGRVNAQQITGEALYHFSDATATAGKYFYRIKIVQNNGAIQYSSVVATNSYENRFAITKIARNGAAKSFVFEVSAPASETVLLSVYNKTGMLCHREVQQVSKGSNALRLNMSNSTASGIYLVHVQYKTEQRSIQLWCP